MGYTHHAQEILELTTDEMVTLGYGTWETDTNNKGTGTSYKQEIKLTVPKGYNDKLYDYLTALNFDVHFGTDVWIPKTEEQLTVKLKTSQKKRREILTDRVSDTVYTYFENGLLL